MQRRVGWWLVPWLLVTVAAQVVAFEVVRRVFLQTRRGQVLDTAALNGNGIGQRHLDELIDTVLSAMTVLSLAVATIVIGFIALIRGRAMLAAAATLLIVAANVTTQLLKHGLARPELGVDLERAAAGNSLPSGHTTVAASVAVALVLVLPPKLRAVAALIGAGYAGLAGIATLSAGWHRPSDAVAALLVVGAWSGVVSLLLVVAHRRDLPGSAQGHRVATLSLTLIGLGLLAVAAIAIVVTDRAVPAQPEWLSERRLTAAYLGGGAGIAGVASLLMAIVLATVHLAVPSRNGELTARRTVQSTAAAEGRLAASVPGR